MRDGWIQPDEDARKDIQGQGIECAKSQHSKFRDCLGAFIHTSLLQAVFVLPGVPSPAIAGPNRDAFPETGH